MELVLINNYRRNTVLHTPMLHGKLNSKICLNHLPQACSGRPQASEDEEEAANKGVKSTAVVKYSSVNSLANFSRLRCNTDLNMPPSNWLSSSAGLYGLQQVATHSTGFSSSALVQGTSDPGMSCYSFRMAHMFPDCVGEVDVVSDAENIKKLLKIPYSKGPVSMMIHCVENTLLIDEFDIHKHLLCTSESEWAWLRQFFFNHVRHTLGDKEKCVSTKNKSRCALQQRSLVSKFLYHSLAEPESATHPQTKESLSDDHTSDAHTAMVGPPLPEPTLEEKLPDPTFNHKFARNVVWTFEDIQMDMSKPINVLTGIDYWLDNLMCNVPEVVMCYHLDGIVQKYELIKTEDLPHLEDSKFSPKVIRDVAQNILSFLKSNATKAGHTYWLFKGKDDDVVKLYDLTSLCTDVMKDKDENPFTVPVAMLLYRVARNMKHSLESRRQHGTILMLLKNCLSLLNKEKYPQIVTSAHYMLSDLYLPAGTDPSTPELQEEEEGGEYEGVQPPPPLSNDIKERCLSSLNHVLAGLHCLPYFPDDRVQETDDQTSQKEEVPKMARPFQAIPMPYSPLQEPSGAELCKARSDDTASWKVHLNTLLLEKACLVYATLTEQRYSAGNYGSALRAICMVVRCHYVTSTGLLGYMLGRAGDACFRVVQHWTRVEEIREEYSRVSETDRDILLHLGQDQGPCQLIPEHILTMEQMLEASRECYLQALALEKPNTNLWRRLGNIENELGVLYMNQAASTCNQDIPEGHFPQIRGLGRFYDHPLPTTVSNRIKSLILSLNAGEVINSENCIFKKIVQTLSADILSEATQDTVPQILSHNSEEDETEASTQIEQADNEYGVGFTSTITFNMPMLGSITANGPSLLVVSRLHHHWSGPARDPYRKVQAATSNSSELIQLFQNSLKHLESGILAFRKVQDQGNLSLLHSNIGRLMRLSAHSHSPHSDTRTNFGGMERHLYNKALSSYRTALQVLGHRRNNPAIWDTVTWELSTTLYSMATLLQDYPDLTNKTSEEAEREVVELFMKALKFCDMDTMSPRQLVYQFRAAKIHHCLGSLYHKTFRVLDLDDSRRKNVLQLTRLHYDKSSLLLARLEETQEFLTVQLERVALQEFLLDNASSFSGKVKLLHSIIMLLLECAPLLQVLEGRNKVLKVQDIPGTSEGDQSNCNSAEELEQELPLLRLLQQRLQFCLRSLAKLHSGRSRAESAAKVYKEMYSLSLQSSSEQPTNLVCHLIQLLSSVQTMLSEKLNVSIQAHSPR
uniref:Erythroid differentiation-related factor 1 n=1 Tax=Timema genevievae TaxID=629358 RepID=A0A7R9JN23_TIMGE|nr:unnamed protein product [Timema genevievae]